MASSRLEDCDIIQLINDSESDCCSDSSDSGEEGSESEMDFDEDPLSSSATWGPSRQRGTRSSVNTFSGGPGNGQINYFSIFWI